MTQGPQSATQAVRAALESDAQHGAVVPPLHLSSNYTFEGFGRPRQYDYTRSGNPTRDALGRALTELEGGAGAVVTASGMSAITLVCQLLRPGDLLIAPHDCYGGSFRLFRNLADRGVPGPTDVLSYPSSEPDDVGVPEVAHLGDVLIDLDAAARQAPDHGHDVTDEVLVLAAHGLTHLRGFDHPDDASWRPFSDAQRRILAWTGE